MPVLLIHSIIKKDESDHGYICLEQNQYEPDMKMLERRSESRILLSDIAVCMCLYVCEGGGGLHIGIDHVSMGGWEGILA